MSETFLDSGPVGVGTFSGPPGLGAWIQITILESSLDDGGVSALTADEAREVAVALDEAINAPHPAHCECSMCDGQACVQCRRPFVVGFAVGRSKRGSQTFICKECQ